MHTITQHTYTNTQLIHNIPIDTQIYSIKIYNKDTTELQVHTHYKNTRIRTENSRHTRKYNAEYALVV